MAPVKTPKASSSKPNPKASTTRRKYPKQRQEHDAKASNALPGVQKIKSALRQARRLLAKDKLAANVKVETERRVRALENDLAEAERVRKEKTMSKKYHKVKFFGTSVEGPRGLTLAKSLLPSEERTKLERKIKQLKKQLDTTTDKKERKQLDRDLFTLRVDLNYVLNYPRTQKYVSLFPSEVRQDDGNKGKAKAEESAETAKTDLQREEIRKLIREQMEQGKLSSEPELEQHGDQAPHHTPRSRSTLKSSQNGSNAEPAVKLAGVQDDAFFGDDSDNENGSEGGEDEDEEMDDS
ncbi:hypothetical protein QCA50_005326 [Cerrena zonata]|uniref:rRNA-processing protein EFG1 n=1 Tax=Cerrena zonata TaxID=2478898 RepID=A0AAW0GQS8_9APHY